MPPPATLPGACADPCFSQTLPGRGAAARSQRRARVLASLVVTAAALGQSPGAAATPVPAAITEFVTGDGSRFLLLPTAGTRLIHWAQATPCSLLEDSPGMEGLTRAVHERSLAGTTELGSRDPAREGFLAEGIIARKLELLQVSLRGETPPNTAIQELQLWQEEIQGLRDRGAYRRLMRSAPAIGPELELTDSTAVLLVSTDLGGLERVGDLLRQRREDASLFGASARFSDYGVERLRAWTADPEERIRSEVAALAFLDGPLRRLGLAPGSVRVATTQAIQNAWERSQHPARAVHVLVGAIDTERVRATLEKVFTRTRLRLPSEPAPPISQSRAQREAALGGAQTAAVFLAMPVPRVRPAAAEAALRWLGDGESSALREKLADAGYRDFAVRTRFPFPAGLGHRAAEGMLLIEAQAGPADPRAMNVEVLRRELEKALTQLRDAAPPPPSLAVFNARLAKEHTEVRRDPARLAVELARSIQEGRTAEEVLAPWRPVTEAECRRFLRKALAPAQRVTVTWRPDQ